MVQIERGGSPRPIDDFITDAPNGLNWVKIGDTPTQGNYITKTAEKIRPEGLPKTREVHPGDLILSNSMSFGKPYIMGIDGCIHDGWLLIRNIYGVFDLTFLCHLLGTSQMLSQYRSLAAGSTVNNLNKELVGNTDVTIPSITEQRLLGDYLEQLDNLITLHQYKYNKVSYVKSTFFTLFWEQRKVTELLKNSSSAMKIGPFGSALKKEYFVDEGIKVYAQENAFTGDFSIGDYYITEDKYKELQSCELYPGDLVISMMGTIGACAIFPENAEKGIMNSHLLRLQFDNEAIPKYIMYLLRDSDLIRKQIDRLSVGSIMSGLSSSVVKKLVFPIPTLAEQKRIVEYLDSLNNLITLHQRKIKYILKEVFIWIILIKRVALKKPLSLNYRIMVGRKRLLSILQNRI